jgi:hypothetical protein
MSLLFLLLVFLKFKLKIIHYYFFLIGVNRRNEHHQDDRQ